jgi:CDP-diacylglycerol--serine O-phosphatidyltransferase
MLLYLWCMQVAGGFGWALVLLFAVCCGLRLARFNTMLGQADLPPYAYNFFTGVPAPGAAGLVMVPMTLTFQFGPGIFDQPPLVAVVLIGVALLMVSKIPTFSGKRVRIPHRWVLPVLLFVGVLTAFLVSDPWLTLSAIGLLYLALIPLSMRAFRRLKRQAEEAAAAQPPPAAEAPPVAEA